MFAGDDWAEDHHDVELMNEQGRVLARKRLPKGVAGMARLHELIGEQLGEDDGDAEVIIGTETVLVWPECGQGSWATTPAPSPLDGQVRLDVGLLRPVTPSVSVQGGCRGGNLALALAPSPGSEPL